METRAAVSERASIDVNGVLAGLERDPPISEDALATLIEHVERTYVTSLPDDYIDFLQTANGADGHLANGIPIALWSAELLPEANLLEGSPWLPGCLLIGSDTGDTVYGIDMRLDAPAERYLESEDVGLDWDYIFWRGRTFSSLLGHLSAPLSSKPSKRGLRNVLRGAFKRS
jgi:hypothetical protein